MDCFGRKKIKKSSADDGTFFNIFQLSKSTYLEDFFTEEDLEAAEVFLEEEDFLALEDLQEELLLLQLDLLQFFEICSTAIDQKYSS